MPLLLLLALIPLVLLVGVGLMPLMLVQRYRVGTARQVARGWLATLNAVGFAVSALVLLVSAAFTNIWLPHTVVYTLAGLGVGCLLGAIGLAISRWEVTPASVHYTPNRWLVLTLTALVAARIVAGLVVAWRQLDGGPVAAIALLDAGGLLAIAGVLLGYALAYTWGLRARLPPRAATRPGRRIGTAGSGR